MILDEIVNRSMLENKDFECKARLDKNNPVGWLKTIGGFANSIGGFFYIGVEDKTNKLIGFDNKEADNERNYFNNMVNQNIYPRPYYDVDFIRYKIRNVEKFIIFVNVYESSNKPITVKYNNVPAIFMRRNGFTNGATYEEIISMSRNNKSYEYDLFDSDESFDKEQFKTLFERYYENNKKELTDKKLVSIGFYNNDYILKNGSLLFMDGLKIGKTTVQLATYSGFTKGDDIIVSIEKYENGIINCIDKSIEYVKQRMNHSIIKLKDKRLDIDSFPERSLFEGIVNAFAYRDYSIDGTQIQVDIFKDRLEIISPGKFLEGDYVNRQYDLTSMISKRRNTLVCEILHMCKMMEAGGTGFEKISEDYKKYDEKHRPYILSSNNQFTLVLPDLTYQEGLSKDNNTKIEFVPASNGTKYDARVLSYCLNGAKRSSEIAKYLGISNSSYFRNTVLSNLVKNGYLHLETVNSINYYSTVSDSVRVN